MNPNHLGILKRGVREWNKWRKENPDIKPDLRRIKFSKANLGGADLSWTNLYAATLVATALNGAILTGANLFDANLAGADLSSASLGGANLKLSDLRGANLNEANLTRADLAGADLRNAYFGAARLIGTNLNGAKLTDACLWETQRAGWLIKGVICDSVYWNKERDEKTFYKPGDFERLFGEKIRVRLFYKDGITPLEIATLPALIQHLESSYRACKLRFHSIEDASGGAIVTITVEGNHEQMPDQLEAYRSAIQSEAEQKAQYLRKALEEENLLLKGEIRALERQVYTFLSRPTYYLAKGNINMSDTYNISGQAGAVGPNAHSHDMTLNQIGSRLETSIDLSQLADELSRLRQAMKTEATNAEHDIAVSDVAKAEEAAKTKDSTKVAEYLQSAGKWALETASKIGVPLAVEALKQAAGIGKA